MKREKEFSSSRTWHRTQVRQGTYAVGLTAIVLVLLIAVNLVMNALPARKTNIDLSPSMIYSISDVGRSLAEGLTQDVNLTIVADKNKNDERVVNFLESYVSLSPHLTLDTVDPVLHPDIVSKYEIADNAVLVRCESTGRYKVVPYSDIIVQGVNEYYAYYYGETVYEERWFDGEGMISSAVNYVISDDNNKLYCLYRHGETGVSDQVTSLVRKANIERVAIDLLQTEIPEDCRVMFMSNPQSDLAAEEVDILIGWLAKGNKMIVTLDTTFVADSFPNLQKVFADYGVAAASGIVYDQTLNAGENNPFLTFATLGSEVTSLPSVSSNDTVGFYMSTPLTYLEGARRSVKYEELFTTSNAGYVIISQDNVTGPGKILLAVKATENENTQLVIFGSGSICDSTVMDRYTNVANARAFMDVLESMYPDSSLISIDSKSLRISYNAVSHGLAWGLAFGSIPLVLLIIGFVIWFRRRRK